MHSCISRSGKRSFAWVANVTQTFLQTNCWLITLIIWDLICKTIKKVISDQRGGHSVSAVYLQRNPQSAGGWPAGLNSGAEGGETQKLSGRTRRCRWPLPRPYAARPKEEDAYAASQLRSLVRKASERRGLQLEKSHIHIHHDSLCVSVCSTNDQQQCEMSVSPLCRLRTEGVIRQVGPDTVGASSCAGSASFCSDENRSGCCRCAEPAACCSKRGALNSFLPVEKKMTDSLCGAWMNGCPPMILCSSSLLLLASLISTFSSLWDLV